MEMPIAPRALWRLSIGCRVNAGFKVKVGLSDSLFTTDDGEGGWADENIGDQESECVCECV